MTDKEFLKLYIPVVMILSNKKLIAEPVTETNPLFDEAEKYLGIPGEFYTYQRNMNIPMSEGTVMLMKAIISQPEHVVALCKAWRIKKGLE